MIRYLHSDGLDIPMADSIQILQAAQNENIKRFGNILTHSFGFVGDSFAPSLKESTLSSKWLVSFRPGDIFLPNGEVISYKGGIISLPITNFGTQYVIISHEMIRMTEGEYAVQITPQDKTVYVTSQIKVRISSGGAVPSLDSNEMIVCRVNYPINSIPTITDLRIPYSSYWSLPYSISSSLTPEFDPMTRSQTRELRESSYSESTLNTESIAGNDDPVTCISFKSTGTFGDICNVRIEKVRGSSYVWSDQLFDANRAEVGKPTISDYDFAIVSNTYRVCFTDAFEEGMATQWSDILTLSNGTGTPETIISCIDATARIRVRKGGVSESGCTCMIWASEATLISQALPLWIGPLCDAAEVYNAGALLDVSYNCSLIYYKVVIINKYGEVISTTRGEAAVEPAWPSLQRMIVLNIQPDMLDKTQAGADYLYSTDMILCPDGISSPPFACYHNPSDTETIITKIVFITSYESEDTPNHDGTINARISGVLTKLFDVSDATGETLTWEGVNPLIVGAGEDLDFLYSNVTRCAGKIYIYAYGL